MATDTVSERELPRASVGETLLVLTDVLAGLVARGVIARRPRVVALAERLDADHRAVKRMQRLRESHGRGPVVLALPVRTMALVLHPDDVHRVLEESPEPFGTANLEKRAALSHFQPHGVLISDPSDRARRRPFNEEVLDEPRPLHRLADAFSAKVREEAAVLLDEAEEDEVIDWDRFIVAWWRVVRRVTLGDAARDDHALTDMLTELRQRANWAYALPKRKRLRERFLLQLRGHLDRAEPGSLASLVATAPAAPDTVRHQQVPQWLFAFDPAGMAAIRALALVSAHPGFAAVVREELGGSDLSQPRELPRLRAAVLESLRLWPTTPAILRETSEPTSWEEGTLAAGSAVTIFAPFFHRDERKPWADRFAPELWLDESLRADWPLVPFSDGPGICPGRNVVQLTTSMMLAAILERHDVALEPADRLDQREPLPGTLNPYSLRFRLIEREGGEEAASAAAVPQPAPAAASGGDEP